MTGFVVSVLGVAQKTGDRAYSALSLQFAIDRGLARLKFKALRMRLSACATTT